MSLPKQIAIIFTLAFVPVALFMGLFIVYSFRQVYTDTVYDSLEAEARAVRLRPEGPGYEEYGRMASIRYSSRSGAYTSSANLGDFVSDESAETMIGKAAAQEDPVKRYVNRIGGKLIYYVVLISKDFHIIYGNDIVIVLTDSVLLRQMVWTASARLFRFFLPALAAGFLIVYLWTRRLVRDIRGIRDGVIAMGGNHYKTRIRFQTGGDLGELAESIERMRLRIIDNERVRQTVIQGVSHDLKTPIGVIASYASAIKDGMCDPGEAADIMLRQTGRLTDKVTKLLHLTRLGYLNTEQVKTESVRMDVLIGELLSSFAFQTGAVVTREIEPVSFTGDAESWRIALENILDNAARYAVSRITVTLREGVLSIYNDGKPIPEADLDSIFNAYEKSRDGKFGLGLSIVRQTTELFGYRAIARNADGGVWFDIYRADSDRGSRLN